MTDKIPLHPVDISALTNDDPGQPASAIQYSIALREGGRRIYGDQRWVADGRALPDHEGGRVERRTVTITYGEWEPAAPLGGYPTNTPDLEEHQ